MLAACSRLVQRQAEARMEAAHTGRSRGAACKRRTYGSLLESSRLNPAFLRGEVLGEQSILNLSDFHGSGARCVLVRHVVDPCAYVIALHRPGIVRFQ